MGSPVAGDLCEMVIRQLEQKVLLQYLPTIILYKRYIDDIIILWRNVPDVSAFVESVHDNPYGLTVELEQANNTGVHFLDLNINIEGSSIHTSVYRKPGMASLYIPVGSCDPFQYKTAAFNTLIKRLFSHSSIPAALATELEHIRHLATIHGYHKLINRLVNRHCRSARVSAIRSRLDNQPEDETRIPVTYNPYMVLLYKAIADKRRIKITHRRCPTILDILRNGKDSPNPNRLPGVYSIPLKDHRCDRNLVYIGSTKQSLGIRIREHNADILHGRNSMALSTYATDPDIEATLNQARLIITSPHPEHLRWLEAIKYSRATTCINYKEELNLSVTWQTLIDTDL
ncbi:uncharacterized protein [Centruroides vittatus]|uniref:uncharacterized protein n=1 Tax=Centruroides vittatus TaxID=120091 RepID=UPI00350E8F8B